MEPINQEKIITYFDKINCIDREITAIINLINRVEPCECDHTTSLDIGYLLDKRHIKRKSLLKKFEDSLLSTPN